MKMILDPFHLAFEFRIGILTIYSVGLYFFNLAHLYAAIKPLSFDSTADLPSSLMKLPLVLFSNELFQRLHFTRILIVL